MTPPSLRTSGSDPILDGTGQAASRSIRGALEGMAIVAFAVATAAIAWKAPIALLAVAAALAGLWTIARPTTAAVVAIGLLYSNATVVAVRNNGAPGALAALVPMLLLVTIAYRVFARREPILLPRPGLWVVTLVLAQMLGAMSSRDPSTSLAAWQATLTEGLVLFVLITNAVRGYESIRRVALLLVVIGALLGTASAVQDATGAGGTFGGFATKSKAVIADGETGRTADGKKSGARRHAGPIGEQNRWAQTLAVMLPVALAIAATDRARTTRVVAAAAAFGIATGIVLTYSRGAFVGLALTALVATLLGWIRAKVAIAAAAVVVLGLATLAPVFLQRAGTVSEVGSSVAGSGSQDQVGGSISNRTTEAQAAITVYLRHPVIGVGVGLFPTYFQDEARNLGADRIVGVNREAHNLYLGVAAESGTLGLLAFGGLSVSTIGSLTAARRRHRAGRSDVSGLATGFALAFVTYLSTGIFLHFAYVRYFWLLAALCAAMGMVDESPVGVHRSTATPVPPGRVETAPR